MLQYSNMFLVSGFRQFKLPWRGAGFVEVPIDDPEVIAASGMSVHRGLVRKIDSSVEGGVLTLSDEQLAQADQYEVSAYARRRVKLTDGRVVWAYVDAHALVADFCRFGWSGYGVINAGVCEF